MQLNNKGASQLLTACMDLPGMTDRERGLLRDMAHHWAMGQQQQWGAANAALMNEVYQIFAKCRKLINVPQPQV